ncbi:hypothetical protein QBC43DRAFT_310533 [Cladorrhinum sp. PSN259]|nr:hypothetical protein QBC43DRAFT_310533 [Cladorrhinum sp. PSN259]
MLLADLDNLKLLIADPDKPLNDKQRSSSPLAVPPANGSSSQASLHLGPPEDTGGSMNQKDQSACDQVEGAFTDSGYASAPPKSKEQRPAEDANDELEADADSRTVISAATTIVPTVAQHSISEICYDIYSNIHGRVDAQNKDCMFEAFTDAIKIFAIRVAHLDSSQVNRQIMHFVYTRHREIAAELRQMFNLEQEEEAEVDETSKPKDGISFTEKILAWLDRPDRQSPEPVDASEQFEGVEDDLDLPSNHAELPLYSQKIFQSKAYKFLIEDLLKESTLQWGESRLWTADAIRHRIMAGFPPTKISKNRDPCIHDIEFQIPQQGIKQRLQTEMERRGVGIREAMLAAVVLVSSSDDAIQVTTLEEYVKQTWGLRDMSLFDIIGGLLAEELSPSDYDSDGLVSMMPALTDNSDGLMSISAALTSIDTISVKAKGVSYSVADRGAQLAWMLAALDDSDYQPGEVTCTRPSIFQASPEDPWEINADVEHIKIHNIPCLSPLDKLFWLDTFIKPVVAHGFPTTRRAPFATGVEISPTVLFSIMFESSLEFRNTHVRLFGLSAGYLELVHQKDNICLWHAMTSQEECICPKDTSFQLSTKNIRQFRHILGDCFHSAGSKCKLNTASPPATTSLCRKNGSSGYGSRATTPRSPSNSLNSTALCPETSLDSDMMSIPDSPEASTSRIPDEIFPIIDAVAHQLFREYKNGFSQKEAVLEDNLCGQQFHGAALGLESGTVRTRPGSSARNLAPADTPALHSAGTSGLPECLKPSQKRARGLGDEDENDDGDGKMPPPKKPRRGQDLPHHKTLACPFWKLDPRRHRKCLKLDSFWLVNRVKQHLTRTHTEPKIFCDKCKTTFPDEAAKERHLRQDGHVCTFKPWNEHLITRSQQVELHRKSRPDTSEAERWFDIWDILFPGRLRPSSPYIDTGVSDDLREFREYTQIRGREVLLERLQAAGFSYRYPDSSLSDQDFEVYRLEAADRAIDAMIEDFLSSRSSQGSAQQQGKTSSDASGQETPVSSFADSGIGSSSQHNLPPISEDDLFTAPNLDLSEFIFDELAILAIDLTVDNQPQASDLDGNFTSSESGPPWNAEFDRATLDWLDKSGYSWVPPTSSPPPDLNQFQG